MSNQPFQLEALRGRLASLATLLGETGAKSAGPPAAAEPAALASATVRQASPSKPPVFRTVLPSRGALGDSSNRCGDASTLAAALARLREAEAGWARDKGAMRLELQQSQKRAQKLEAELRRVKDQLAFRSGELSHLKAALKARDVQLADAQDRLRQLEAADSGDRVARETVEAALAERDQLREALQAMVARLEETTGLLANADGSFANMAESLQQAEAARAAAEDGAAVARAEAQAAQAEVEDLRWRVGLLSQLGALTVQSNEEQAASLRQLLDSEALLEEDGDA